MPQAEQMPELTESEVLLIQNLNALSGVGGDFLVFWDSAIGEYRELRLGKGLVIKDGFLSLG